MTSLPSLLPATGDPDAVLDAITTWTAEQGLDLYPHQVEALLEVLSDSHVVVATPTGSGKSLVALGAHAWALASGRRTFYTAPLKALVSEKFFSLVDALGAERVGMLTGDASVNADAPVVCCTAEVLARMALRQGDATGVDQVVMDEFHFYADPDRGWAWQVPLLEMTSTQFVLMSATLGDTRGIREGLQRRTGRPVAEVTTAERPVPLHFRYAMTPVHETVEELLEARETPVYVVHPTQAGAVERAQALMSTPVAGRAQKDAIAEALGGFRFSTGFGKALSRYVRAGIGVHHAGMLPRYRRLVERLAQAGLLTVVCGTDTLGVGINVPIRTVLVTQLSKYDGRRTRLLRAREFHQVAGRAGRAGFDTSGTVVVQAPDHAIENARALAKAGDDPKKRRKVVRKKAPDGQVSWDQSTFERLVAAEPEPLVPRFRVTHALLLDLLARPGEPVAAFRRLVDEADATGAAKVRHVRQAVDVLRSLLEAGVVERLPEPEPDGRRLRLVVDLPSGFALNQPLSAFALAALDLLDRDSPTFALDVLSVLESVLDDPRPVLLAQQFRARGEAVAQMKADGVEYEERMELLEDVTWPKPLAELLEAAFSTYRRGHPWVMGLEPSPKSVARDMHERALTFGELVQLYGLARSEGLVLRYLADAYKALQQVVPPSLRTEEVDDLAEWLGELVRQTDSSLLEEWERLTDPAAVAEVARTSREEVPPALTANDRAFRVLVRNALFRRVELVALRRWDDLGALDGDDGWTADAWRAALEPYWAEHADVGTGPGARGPALHQVERAGRTWRVRQVLDDPARDHDWAITAEVDLDVSDEAGGAVVRVVDVGAA